MSAMYRNVDKVYTCDLGSAWIQRRGTRLSLKSLLSLLLLLFEEDGCETVPLLWRSSPFSHIGHVALPCKFITFVMCFLLYRTTLELTLGPFLLADYLSMSRCSRILNCHLECDTKLAVSWPSWQCCGVSTSAFQIASGVPPHANCPAPE